MHKNYYKRQEIADSGFYFILKWTRVLNNLNQYLWVGSIVLCPSGAANSSNK